MGRLSMLLKGFFASRTEILKRKSMSHSKSTVSGRGKRQGAQHSMRGWVLSHWGQRVYLQLKSWNNESVPSSRRVSGWSQIRRSIITTIFNEEGGESWWFCLYIPTLVNCWSRFCCCQTLPTGSSLSFNLINETSTAWHTQGKHDKISCHSLTFKK